MLTFCSQYVSKLYVCPVGFSVETLLPFILCIAFWTSGSSASVSEVIFCEFVQNSSEVHANAAETLSAITCIPQSALATKLASPM